MSLFQDISFFKNIGEYKVANILFAQLLDIAIDHPREYKLIWESTNLHYRGEVLIVPDWEKYDPDNNYFDLLVISDGLRKSCIPAPLLKNNVAKALMSLVSIFEDKHHSLREHDFIEEDEKKAKVLEILKKYPQALEKARKYLKQTLIPYHGCEKCVYFYGDGGIHCAIHPFGKIATECGDFCMNAE